MIRDTTSALLLVDMSGDGALYQRIYAAIRGAILDGRLASGAKLPSTRYLAEDLKVSRTVVLRAFDQLRAEGYIAGRHGSGTYVAALPPDALTTVPPRTRGRPVRSALAHLRLSRAAQRVSAGAPPLPTAPLRAPRYPLTVGSMIADDFPTGTWQRILYQHAKRFETTYGTAEGYGPLRRAIANYLRQARAIVCEPDDVLVVAGARRGFDVLARLVLNSGDWVAVEDPHYAGLRRTFEAAGARLQPIPVDEEGLDVDRLASLRRRIALAAVTPSHQFPTGAVLAVGRRLRLLQWAADANAIVLEDDYDAEFQFDSRPIESLRGLDHTGRVLYVGTFSKILSPDLRIGYVVVPESVRDDVRRLLWVTDRQVPTLPQRVLAEFIEEGHFTRHVRRLRARIGQRRLTFLAALEREFGDHVRVGGAAAGVHVMMTFPELPVGKMPALMTRLTAAGIETDAIHRHYLRPPAYGGLVAGYGGLRDDQIEVAIQLLARAYFQTRDDRD